MLDLYRRVSPEQLLHASDFPYGQLPQHLLLDLRIARLAGYSEDELRAPPRSQRGPDRRRGAACGADAAQARHETLAQPIQLYAHPHLPDDGDAAPLDAAAGRDGAVGLALNAAAERRRPRGRRASGSSSCSYVPATSGATLPEIEDEEERTPVRPRAFQLIHLADIEALTIHA